MQAKRNYFAPYGGDYGYEPPFDDHRQIANVKWIAADVPHISAGIDKWALLANGGIKCNSVPVQVEKWPFIIQRCERPIRGRYLAFVKKTYSTASMNFIFNRIHKVYVSGDGKNGFARHLMHYIHGFK